MLAFALSLILLAFWTVTGFALLIHVRGGLNRLQEILLAPVTGMLCTVIPVFILSRLGLPVKSFGVGVTVVIALAAAAAIFPRRKHLALTRRDCLPAAGLMLLALLVSGWPMFRFGFDWLSLCNDDMANYVLGATRFFDHGWFELPPVDAMMSGRDYTLSFWFFHVLSLSRGGCELMIAWMMSLTGKSGHDVYMPLILVMDVTLAAASGALVAGKTQDRLLIWMTSLLVAVSALTTFGMLYQLIAQVTGLPILTALSAVLLRRFDTSSWKSIAGQTALVSLYGVGLLIIYPEVVPFIGIAWILFLAISMLKRDLGLKGLLIVPPLSLVVTAVLLRKYFFTSTVYLLGQARGSTAETPGGDFFPFYRIPSGLAALWGFKPVFRPMIDPFASVAIAVAIPLIVVTTAAAVWMAWRRRSPAAMICLVMIVLSGVLFKHGSGFGLYKLAMYIQPFMLAVLAMAWFEFVKTPKWRVAPLLALALPGFMIQQAYVSYSRGLDAVFLEIPDATQQHVTREFRDMLARHPEPSRILLDTYNVVLAKYQSIYTRGRPTSIPGNAFGIQMMTYPLNTPAGDDLVKRGTDIGTALDENVERLTFNLRPGQAPSVNSALNNGVETDPEPVSSYGKFKVGWIDTRFADMNGDSDRFIMHNQGRPRTPAEVADTLFIGDTYRQSLFNRYNGSAGSSDATADYFAMPLRDVRNRLIFIPSELGRLYGYRGQKLISVYQLEIDPNYYLGTTFAGIGRFSLFYPINPTPDCRLVIELCCSLKGDGENRLPTADIIGDKRYRLPFEGRGSARVFSPPMNPQMINGRPYICLDLGEGGKMLPEIRTGLNQMYGKDVPIDWRRLVAFARDVSLVSNEQFAAMRGPTNVHFDIDERGLLRGLHPLRNKSLEYSGIYEDAWCSDAAFVHLTQPSQSTELKIMGMVARLPVTKDDFTQEITVFLDGVPVAKQTMGLGPFELHIPVDAAGAGQRRVEMRFSKNQHFEFPDNRPVACQLLHVGFELPAWARSQIESVPADISNPKFKFTGLSADGWMPKVSTFDLTQLPQHDALVLRGMVPKTADSSFTTEVRVLIDGVELIRKRVGLDVFELRIPVAAGATDLRHVEIQFTDVQRLSAADDREVGAHLRFLGFQTTQPPGDSISN